jgi:hypothetical protein
VKPETESRSSEELAAENAALREAVGQLEAQISEQAARTNEIVARVEDSNYWLSRWHLDLNALMKKPGAAQARGLIRLMRAPVRLAKKVKRKIAG